MLARLRWFILRKFNARYDQVALPLRIGGVAVREPEGVSNIPFQRKAHANRHSCVGSLRDVVVDHILELGGVPVPGVVDGRNPWAFPS